MIRNRKVYISDPWIIKEFISAKPDSYTQKAELLVIYKVNVDGEDSCFFTYSEIQKFCAEYNLSFDKLIRAFYDLLSLQYRISGQLIMPYKDIVKEPDGISIHLDEQIIDHYYNPLARLEN